MSQEVLYDVFEAMKVSDEDCQLIDAICDRVEPLVACTPEEESAAERFFWPSSKGVLASKLVAAGCRT